MDVVEIFLMQAKCAGGRAGPCPGDGGKLVTPLSSGLENSFENVTARCNYDEESCDRYEEGMVEMLPSELYDEIFEYITIARLQISVLDDTYDIATCKFVQNAFAVAKPGCKETIKSIKILFIGTMLISLSFFAMWVTLIVVISRLLNRDRMIDAGTEEVSPLRVCINFLMPIFNIFNFFKKKKKEENKY